MAKPPDDAQIAAVVTSLTPEEQAALPARLRATTADQATREWNDAKARRDAALQAADELEDPDERVAAIDAAKAEWTAFKAGQRAEG
jgi:hypothetical protein